MSELTPEQARDRHRRLAARIHAANRAYYTASKPLMMPIDQQTCQTVDKAKMMLLDGAQL